MSLRSGLLGSLLPQLLTSRREGEREFTALRLFNLILNRLEMKLGRTHLLSRPYELCIDVSNKCNLGCPFCPTGRRENGRGKGNITHETFRAILDELAPYAFRLELFNWGEAFFNPELPQLIADAHRRRLVTVISSNLSFRLDDDYVRSIIRGGLTHLTAAVDGADQESYEVYRRGGKFALVMENLRKFVRLKRELNSDFPRLCWQYLVFAHNEGRIDEARRLAQEIGLDSFAVSGGLYDDPSWAPRENYSFDYLEVHPNRCTWLWKKAVFHWDGGMASCCMGFYKHDDFADWQPGSFRRMWNNDKFVSARRIWTQKNSPLPEGHFCTSCDKVRLYRGLPLESRMRRVAESPEVAAKAAG
jgi:hypothetical protein